jgi:photosynthetic reaction center H subunit
MHAGPITPYIDVAQLALYAFWIFFAGLIFYLRREDKREGYPLDSGRGDRVAVMGYPSMPSPKTFILAHGGLRMAPRYEPPEPVLGADYATNYRGAPLDPTGNPLLDAIGPAAYANRADEPDLTWGDGLDKIVPLRVAREFSIPAEDPDPRGMEVIGADNEVAGVVVDAWVDRSEMIFRYLELTLIGTTHTVLVPMTFVQFLARRRLKVRAIRSDQFAEVPALRSPDKVTLLEEDKIMAYYGGGQLYALPGRLGPLI